MNIEEFKSAIDNKSDLILQHYFNGDEKEYKNSIRLLHKIVFQYQVPSLSYPILLTPFKNYISLISYCRKEPYLVGSLLYLNLMEPTFLVSDISSFSNSDNIKWDVKPDIESIAAAEQLFQNAKQKITEILTSSKINKKDTNEILKLIEPLSGAKNYNDIQQVYWMLYCELRFTIQLLKPDKDFEVSFEFDKAWLDLREKDVPLLKILSQISMEEYIEADFDKTTIAQIKNIYINTENPIPKAKTQNQVSDSAPISLLGHIEGLSWEDISMTLVSLDSIRIKAHGYTNVYHFIELGMQDKRSKEKSNDSWKLLSLFAMEGGTVKHSDIDKTRRYTEPKKAISDLRKKLKQVFGLQENPIDNYESRVGYKTKFQIFEKIPKQYFGSDQQKEDTDSYLE